MPHWRRIKTSLLDPAPLGTTTLRCHAVIYLSTGRCELRTRYFKDGKLIIGAAKLIDLDNYIKIFKGYFTKYIHASTLFLFNTSIFIWKQMSKVYEPPNDKTNKSDQSLRCALNGWVRPQAFFIRTAKTLIRLGGCPGWSESSLGSYIKIPSFFDAMYIFKSLNYAVIKQILSSKQCISFFLSFH